VGSEGILGARVSTVRGIGEESAKLLARLGIRTIADLLWHLPRRYDDLSKLVPLRSLREGPSQSAIAVVGRISERRTSRGTPLTEMELLEESGVPSKVRATWFGRQFVKQRVREGQRVRLGGKLKWFGRGLVFDNPDIEPADSEGIHTGRIVPVHTLTEGISDKQMRRWLHNAVEAGAKKGATALVEHVPEPLPEDMRRRHALPPIGDALRQVHFPDDPIALFGARRRLAFDELLVLQLATAQRRARWIAEAKAVRLQARDDELAAWISALPFTLTASQQRVLERIRADLAATVPMSRLLEGDVGSGKTVVAALAMRIASASGTQSALMAPTELLAEQHFRTLSDLFAENGPRVELLTASVPAGRRAAIREDLASGRLDAVVGTHALLEEDVTFMRLALVVVDEQQRFGVRQRSLLREKGIYPHVLLTTATPIPQTLWQTLNRDLDVSTLDELPAGRGEIRTEVRTPDALPRLWPWVKEHVALGEQAFVVCPRIDPADEVAEDDPGEQLFETRDAPLMPSAVATEEELRRGALAGLRIGLVHGRMPQKERDAIMTRFRDRELDVLVATTVIEVGIDIPNATMMVVLGAERFGLAQLHQLRGRVGRGTQRSYCVLVSPTKDSDRLKAMSERVEKDGRERVLNGFELAQRDLEIRGPGQFLGKEQSGLADQLRVVDLTDIDPRLLEDVGSEVDRTMAADPGLERPEHRALREAVDELWRRYAQV
jgi:ATP-dependent DNA helicase RecG